MQCEEQLDKMDAFQGIDIIGTLWKRRRIIAVVTAICAMAGVAYALLAVEWYQSTLVMVPANTNSRSASNSQLGSLASLAGISIGSDGSAQESIAVLRSKAFARAFIEDKGLIQVLSVSRFRFFSPGGSSAEGTSSVDVRDAVQFFDKNVRSVVEDKKSGTVVLSITWKTPGEAAAWANSLVSRLNEKMRAEALAEAQRNIQYLQKAIVATNITALQQSIGKVLESEMQKLLLAQGTMEYAFKVVDPATSPKRRIRPRRSVIVAMSILLGMLGSSAIVILVEALKRSSWE